MVLGLINSVQAFTLALTSMYKAFLSNGFSDQDSLSNVYEPVSFDQVLEVGSSQKESIPSTNEKIGEYYSKLLTGSIDKESNNKELDKGMY